MLLYDGDVARCYAIEFVDRFGRLQGETTRGDAGGNEKISVDIGRVAAGGGAGEAYRGIVYAKTVVVREYDFSAEVDVAILDQHIHRT